MESADHLFDEEDQAIFSSADFDLKAKVIRYHLMPRMDKLLREALTQVRDVFEIDGMDSSTISRSPGFRTDRRKGPVTLDYTWCSLSLCGTRKPIWNSIARKKDGLPPKVFWIKWGLILTDEGLIGVVSSASATIPLTQASHDLLLAPFIANAGGITELCALNDVEVLTAADNDDRFRSLEDRFRSVSREDEPLIEFRTGLLAFPISEEDGLQLALRLAELFPLYDAMLRVARGKQERIAPLLSKLNAHYEDIEMDEEEVDEVKETKVPSLKRIDLSGLAIERTVALPAKRWQVLQRDDWRCVSCGKMSTDHNVILHVDHILPRSLRGTDDLSNYQTLCELCNLGKSNRNSTNIRNHHASSRNATTE